MAIDPNLRRFMEATILLLGWVPVTQSFDSRLAHAGRRKVLCITRIASGIYCTERGFGFEAAIMVDEGMVHFADNEIESFTTALWRLKMTHKTDRELLEEIQQRAIRTETRMLQLGDHVGANLRSKQRIDIEPTPHSVVAYVDSYDVSFSRVMAEIKGSHHWIGAKPGVHMVQVRMGERREYLVIGEVAVQR